VENSAAQVLELYGNRVRVRMCGICVDNDKILLTGHRLPGHDNLFWSPPGGGLQFGETSVESLQREFQEETGLKVEVGPVLFLNEFIKPPLHAIEVFFRINSFEGKLVTGKDPELAEADQIIEQVCFMTIEEIERLPEDSKHSIFKGVKSLREILDRNGFI
jgi:8-oxo-dGTP diphosphatase